MKNSAADRQVEPVVIHEDACTAEGWADPVSGGVQWWTLLSGDRTPSNALTCGVVEIGPGTGGMMIPHRHAQAEVYHILSGQGVVTIAGRAHPLRQGATVFIPGGAEHSTRNTGTEPLRLFYVFAVDAIEEVAYES